MGMGDMVDKAKEALSGHSQEANEAIDKTKDAAKNVAPDQADAAVDKAADAAKKLID